MHKCGHTIADQNTTFPALTINTHYALLYIQLQSRLAFQNYFSVGFKTTTFQNSPEFSLYERCLLSLPKCHICNSTKELHSTNLYTHTHCTFYPPSLHFSPTTLQHIQNFFHAIFSTIKAYTICIGPVFSHHQFTTILLFMYIFLG